MDACDELLVRERAHEVVVCSFERTDGVVAAAEHDHGPVGRHMLEAIEIAEDEHVRIGRARQRARRRKREHVEAVAPQLPLEEAAHRGLGLGEEKCGHGARR